jgi:hypothetical protein
VSLTLVVLDFAALAGISTETIVLVFFVGASLAEFPKSSTVMAGVFLTRLRVDSGSSDSSELVAMIAVALLPFFGANFCCN